MTQRADPEEMNLVVESPQELLEQNEIRRRRDPLGRAIQLLVHMVDSGEEAYGVRELGTRLGASASTAHRLLGELEQLGMVDRTPSGTYRVGLEFLRIARTSIAQFPLHDKANDVLCELTRRSEETSFLSVYSSQRQQMMFTLSIESAHPLRYVLQLNKWLSVHTGASGLAILAFLPDEDRREIVEKQLGTSPDISDDTLRLTERLTEIKRQGYASSRAERIVGAVAVAAPVFGPSGEVFGDVGVTIPESRFNETDEPVLAGLVVHSAEILTVSMGGTVPTS
ncbi:IclR family transcriptional regulator [Rhodococcus sp. ACPA4]|uniref:IclR family transcriptional regulator n=1 Tax=Rhodococcus globerulus TaxID=33008 RepID=A0ABU4C1Y5_RHOGO|nr:MULTISPECIES: IclR family transcriptional regulator [Rhodococcus]NMD64328.1 IclR family transcriptional regulator [Nocardia globerula]MCE4265816.1 IclR family transcriptional regulator [Rhodococcus globerulus]MDV6270486.1 IclR family transcriptional regulator [Rhodococcus globerulus]MDV8071098.1 IclR family transcriptional regulator [Rhodococcus sp. IEGM 1366]NRI70030.1 IclR family transcriptional regulator [Rhodococcus sp. MS16]